MQLELTQFENVTREKVVFIEEQANKLLSFLMESRKILTQEAHTTLQWLFALITGSAGYVVTLLKPAAGQSVQWWLVGPLAAVVILAAIAAIRLFHLALRATPVLPSGNEPKNLATDTMLAYDEHWIRFAEAAQLQERIEAARQHNCRIGDAVNEARWVVAGLPIAALIAVGFCRIIAL